MSYLPHSRFMRSTAFWSLLTTLLVLLAYALPSYLLSVGEFDTSSVLASLRSSLLAPTWFWGQLGYFFLMLLLCHFLFFYLLAEAVRVRYTGKERVWRTVGIWLAGLLLLQVVNSGFFPHSTSAFELAFGMTMPLVAGALLSLLLVVGVGGLWWRWVNHPGRWRWGISALLVLVTAGAGLMGRGSAEPAAPRQGDQPDIFMISVDALRPDRLSYMHAYDKSFKGPMPFLDQQLAQSVVFSRAYAVAGRTYPSWMAMLTGLDPLYSGVRYNLQNDYGWWEGKVRTLPQYLKQQGYQTLWGIDETSFANIGERQGFDRVVGPAVGAASLLVSATLADVPLVNLLSNMPMGAALFPLTFSNRAVGQAYYPSTFSRQLDTAVRQADRNKPLFMAVHYELPHYPVIWADDGMPKSVLNLYNTRSVAIPYYRYSLSRVDQQIRELMETLEQQGRLRNAIVFFLSDHGNGYFEGAMAKNRHGEEVYLGDDSTGHGTDVLNLSQYQSLLAVRGFGQYQLPPGYRDAIVSTLDVTPTILWTLGLQPHEPLQGEPLDVLGTAPGGKRRVVYFMSGISFRGLGTGDINLARDLASQAKRYQILPNGRLVINNKFLPSSYKQQAVVAADGNHMIASDWVPEKQERFVAIIDMKNGNKSSVTTEALQIPEIAQLGFDFCQHFTTNNPAFDRPAFCDAIKVDEP